MSRSNATPPQQTEAVHAEHREEMRLNTLISRVLVVGLLAAVALLIVGVILILARPGEQVPHMTAFADMPRELAAGRPGGFFELGLLVLLVTPFARVVALGIAFGRRRQWLFASISVLVASLLIVGGVLGVSLG